jgi:hypothetical protein
VHNSFPASSRERCAAAATVRVIRAGRSGISTASPAAVVPAGLVTLMRSCSADSGEASASAPAPETVARASRIARSGASPAATPAAAMASIMWNT